MQRLHFPKNFLWGAATAAHQIEGDNTNSDWWEWEHSQKRLQSLLTQSKKPEDFYSGIACDSYRRYDEDFALAKHLNHNATRLSLEWARIMPRPGDFDEKEFEHYEKVLQSAKYHQLSTFVTLHHFTNPKWFARMGGFEHKANVKFFEQYCLEAARRLGEYVDFWITLNEPEGHVSGCYISGVWPPQKKNVFLALRVARHLGMAHNQIAPKIKGLTGKPVGVACDIVDLQPTGRISNLLMKLFYDRFNKFVLYKAIGACDFVGVNYYFHHHLGIFGHRNYSLSHHETSDLGWGIHPEGLERVLLYLKKYRKPLFITENGLADAQDAKRERFIKDHLYYLHRAIGKGADVRGYLHWSLMDNFEWEKGFSPRFGLVEIDRDDFLRRKVRYSATMYAEICRNNYMDY